ncbi:N-acetyltransferase [Propionigenium maris DSM 9537]|uniref:N-acetyltransferase n=1 Tax=Propionigenium maris DSM 9537 TaxID=1123000 RepID=A0A9W6LMC9_9FUSO|nr:GNAT family N-acetyltransferase [Propionigenium maris]GLI56206.1 N-acetyltransferase [Propionigenium maris DSM 9537]
MIRKTRVEDIEGIYTLYRRVARIPGGLARYEDEITKDYIEGVIKSSMERGLSLVVDIEGRIAGELHAYRPGLRVFDHVLSDLTICIDPDLQGRGLGRELFEEYLKRVEVEMEEISRVELIARESNRGAIEFYRSLGFVVEGSFAGRIRGVDGELEADIPMAHTIKDL